MFRLRQPHAAYIYIHNVISGGGHIPIRLENTNGYRSGFRTDIKAYTASGTSASFVPYRVIPLTVENVTLFQHSRWTRHTTERTSFAQMIGDYYVTTLRFTHITLPDIHPTTIIKATTLILFYDTGNTREQNSRLPFFIGGRSGSSGAAAGWLLVRIPVRESAWGPVHALHAEMIVLNRAFDKKSRRVPAAFCDFCAF
jgi:hypothetical protein